ncbi:hypothetical protein KIN20_025167 [Parelaphostrongylus tenuis]|uniref:Uncharacterized protein n=1 Tax=Parelaphostrongylus tenuis TaxID=148309 RepID=A0AAD5MZ61_PARTN|nr:hypothetical protein KIN20_025167 [Parelaphostrongylus tenuis]
MAHSSVINTETGLPQIVEYYNKGKGAVDYIGQMDAYSPILKEAKKWSSKLSPRMMRLRFSKKDSRAVTT